MSVTTCVIIGIGIIVLAHTVIDYVHAYRLDRSDEDMHRVRADIACQRGNIEAMKLDFDTNVRLDKTLYNRVKANEASIDIAFERLNALQAMLNSQPLSEVKTSEPDTVCLDPVEGSKAEQA